MQFCPTALQIPFPPVTGKFQPAIPLHRNLLQNPRAIHVMVWERLRGSATRKGLLGPQRITLFQRKCQDGLFHVKSAIAKRNSLLLGCLIC